MLLYHQSILSIIMSVIFKSEIIISPLLNDKRGPFYGKLRDFQKLSKLL